MLPNFVVIGAGKSGTSSIYHWLRSHPDVYMPARLKETFFFCYDEHDPEHRALAGTARFPITTREQYEALFDGAGSAKAIGEATPRYLDIPEVPGRLRAMLPHAALIASLRDPVDRILSHAQMNIRLGLASDIETDVRRMATTDEHEYASKLRRWFDAFPREQFLLFRFDDLVADPLASVQRIFRFLDVDPEVVPPVETVYNPGGVPRSQAAQRVLEMPSLRRLRPYLPASAFGFVARLRRLNSRPAPPPEPDLVEWLADRYRADIAETAEITGLDLSGWTPLRPRAGSGDA